jgi:hypothetical protein
VKSPVFDNLDFFLDDLSRFQIGKLEVNICPLFSPAKVNDDGEISVSHSGIVNARPPLRTGRLALYTHPNKVSTGMQALNLEPPQFISKSGGELQVSSRYGHYCHLHIFRRFSICSNDLSSHPAIRFKSKAHLATTTRKNCYIAVLSPQSFGSVGI